MDKLLFQACAFAETYKSDRVEAGHLVMALMTRDDPQAKRDLLGLPEDEVTGTLEAGFRFLRRRHGVEAPRLVVPYRVLHLLERSLGSDVFPLQELMLELGATPSPADPAPFEPLPHLDDLLDAVEREQALNGFGRICNDVFARGGGPAAAGPGAKAPDKGAEDAELKADQKGGGGSGSAPEKASLSGKERAEAKRAVERSIRDLTALVRAGELDPVVGRDAEIDQVCRVLMRRRKSNVLLVGEPGVGKTALMEGVAARIAASADPVLRRRPVLQASLGALVAGARYRGDFEIRMELLVEHALERGAVLFFDEMQMLIGSGATAERGMDGANLLKPVLARDGMSLVGATTNEEAAVIRADPALMRRFEPVVVNEPDPELMREIVAGAAAPYLTHHGVRAEARVLDRLVEFADRYLPDRRFPDKAFDLLDAACVQARLAGHTLLRVEAIRAAVRQLGGALPGGTGPDPEARRAAERRMIARLSERVGAQPEAVRRLAELLCAPDRSGPVIARLSGPDGVGRRTLARELARTLGGALVELDAGLGSERVRSGVLAAARPGTRPVVLINDEDGADQGVTELIRGRASTGGLRSDQGRLADLSGAVILLRGANNRRPVGFQREETHHHVTSSNITSIHFYIFSGDRLKEAVQFELNRLSRLWSDSGISRPVPDVETVLNGTLKPELTWSEITRLCCAACGETLDYGA